MARYTGPVCRLCRREGEKLFLKGEKCNKSICPITVRTLKKRGLKPGQHTDARRRNMSEYGTQLREKQKAKRIYGILETQFKNYYIKASKQKGISGENLLKMLELRLDNVVYRLGFGRSRTEARQIVRHNLIRVNGKKVNIPSYQCKKGDVIDVRPNAADFQRFKDILEVTSGRLTPAWITSNPENLSGTVLQEPTRDMIDTQVRETSIVELYSK
ncbi:MAG: 30S ribosomal protein S4 [Defluviitaleaceae bacterium]|nr:30S ribosomal protein S4 [Defluviitaleaceae bacterium]